MINNINIILSYLNISDAKPYVKAWRGKIDEKELEKIKENIFNNTIKKLENPKANKSLIEIIIDDKALNEFSTRFDNLSDKDKDYILKYFGAKPDGEGGMVYNTEKLADYYSDIFINKNFKYYMDDKTKNNKKVDLSNLYKDLFNGKYRIVLPLPFDVKLATNSFKGRYYEVKEIVEKCIKLYFEYYNTKHSYKDWLVGTEQFVTGYIENKKESKRKISLGKIFSELISNKKGIEEINKIKSDIKEVNTIYNQRPAKKDDLFIVVSRHPYDIAGMSTGRGWGSCMHLVGGGYREYVLSSLVNGALIAYTVNKNDLNLENPINRLLIKPYVKENEKIDFENPNFILYPSMIYGAEIIGFEDTIIKWLNDNWNNKYKEGKFYLDKNFYNESSDYRYIDLSDNTKKYKTDYEYDEVKHLNYDPSENEEFKELELTFTKCPKVVESYIKTKSAMFEDCNYIANNTFGSYKEDGLKTSVYIANTKELLNCKFYGDCTVRDIKNVYGCYFEKCYIINVDTITKSEIKSGKIDSVKNMANSYIYNTVFDYNVGTIENTLLLAPEIIENVNKIYKCELIYPKISYTSKIDEISDCVIKIKVFNDNYDFYYRFLIRNDYIIKNSKILLEKRMEEKYKNSETIKNLIENGNKVIFSLD